MIPFKRSLSLIVGLVVLAAAAILITTTKVAAHVDADRSARNTFDASCFTNNYDSTSGQASCTIFTIPADSQVVIETVACTAEVAAGQGPAQADLIIPNNLTNYLFPLAMTKQTNATTTGVDIWAITNQIRAYGNSQQGGTTSIGVFFRASLPNLSPPQGMNCTIAGYVVQQ